MDILSSGTSGTITAPTGLVVLYINDGDQSFSPQTIVSGSTVTRGIATADVNRDGRLDIITSGSAGISWHENLGTGAFTSRTMSTSAQLAVSIVATDLDLDGDVDVVYGSESSPNRIGWIEQKAGLTFAYHPIFTPATQIRSVQVADFDGDGDLDIISGSSGTGVVGWYRNDGQQNFVSRPLSNQQGLLNTIYAADMDGDGDIDLLAASFGSLVSWYENLNFVPPPGDYNRNGIVEASDYNVWRSTFGSTFDLRADGNANNIIDAADYVFWRKQLESTAPASGAATLLDRAAPALSTSPEVGELEGMSAQSANAIASAADGEATLKRLAATSPSTGSGIVQLENSPEINLPGSNPTVGRPAKLRRPLEHFVEVTTRDRALSALYDRLSSARGNRSSSEDRFEAWTSHVDTEDSPDDVLWAAFADFDRPGVFHRQPVRSIRSSIGR
jgi:hypothetical protein